MQYQPGEQARTFVIVIRLFWYLQTTALSYPGRANCQQRAPIAYERKAGADNGKVRAQDLAPRKLRMLRLELGLDRLRVPVAFLVNRGCRAGHLGKWARAGAPTP